MGRASAFLDDGLTSVRVPRGRGASAAFLGSPPTRGSSFFSTTIKFFPKTPEIKEQEAPPLMPDVLFFFWVFLAKWDLAC